MHNLVAPYDSSLSSNSKESRSWVNIEQNRYSPSDDSLYHLISPDSSQNQQLMPPRGQGVNFNDFVRESLFTPHASSRFSEGPFKIPESIASSLSEDSEYEPTSKIHVSSLKSFSNCYSFMSKPVHPEYNIKSEDNTLYSYMELTNVSNLNMYERSICGLCEKFLFQKSPWGAHKLIYSGDMPISSVLSCGHVYHAECLERITPKSQKHDPPCAICKNSENNNICVENWAICRMKNGLPRLRSLGEESTSKSRVWSCGKKGYFLEGASMDGPMKNGLPRLRSLGEESSSKSRVWSCGQNGDFVAGASMDVPIRSSNVLLRNRSRMKRQLSLKGENSKRSVVCSPCISIGAVGSSSQAVKGW